MRTYIMNPDVLSHWGTHTKVFFTWASQCVETVVSCAHLYSTYERTCVYASTLRERSWFEAALNKKRTDCPRWKILYTSVLLAPHVTRVHYALALRDTSTRLRYTVVYQNPHPVACVDNSKPDADQCGFDTATDYSSFLPNSLHSFLPSSLLCLFFSA